MKKPSFQEAIEQIRREDPRYTVEAYDFIREALDYAMKHLERPRKGHGRHVTGQELLVSIREFTLREFGPISKRVLNHWGIHSTEDFGHVVFNLVDKGILGKTEGDRIEDFADGYDFADAFVKPFLPDDSSVTKQTTTKGTGK
ncbi:MAG: hypothetical protein EOM20_01995 [Spartobacteria bacterium]|nr:hypothetical protein [Spartobacteria bacterium]